MKIKAPSVWLGQSVTAPTAVKTCRDPLVQDELNKIKSALNGVISYFNSHDHPYVNGSSPATTSQIVNKFTGSYTVGDTESNSVYVD